MLKSVTEYKNKLKQLKQERIDSFNDCHQKLKLIRYNSITTTNYKF